MEEANDYRDDFTSKFPHWHRQNKYLFQKFCLHIIAVLRQTAISPHCTAAYKHIRRLCLCVCMTSAVAFHTTRLDFYIIIKSSFHSVYFESRRTLVQRYLTLARMVFGLESNGFADFVFHFHHRTSSSISWILLCVIMQKL